MISNAGTGKVYPTAEVSYSAIQNLSCSGKSRVYFFTKFVQDEQDLESTPNIILGSKWTGFWINWGGGFVSVGLHGSAKPLFLDEYKKKNTISSLYPDSFLYYGLMGTGVLWSTEFCQESKKSTVKIKYLLSMRSAGTRAGRASISAIAAPPRRPLKKPPASNSLTHAPADRAAPPSTNPFIYIELLRIST